MKVVFLHPAYYEQQMGGAEQQIAYIMDILAKNKFEIHYIFEDSGTEIVNKNNIYLHPLKKIRLRRTFGNYFFLHKKNIYSILNKIEPDVIYTRIFISWSGIAAIYSKKHDCKHIWALAHDKDLIRLVKKPPVYRILEIIENQYVKLAFKYANVITTQNSFQQNALFEVYGRVGKRIPQLVPEYTIRKKNSIKDGLIVLWIANLKPIKQPMKFVQLAETLSLNNKIQFRMIGRIDSKYEKLLENAQKQNRNFKYLGELSNDEVNNLLVNAHILVNTSKMEGFSNTFLQAWMRKVVVLSMHSNPDDILTREEIGYVCPTVQDIKDKINFLVDNNEHLKKMSDKAYHYAYENHSLELNNNNIISLMQSS